MADPHASTPLKTLVERLGEAHRRADREVMKECFDALFGRWKARPDASLAAAIRALGSALESPAAGRLRADFAETRKLDQAEFMRAMQAATIVDRGAFLDLMHDGTVKELCARARVVAEWSPDPRVAYAFLDLLHDVPRGGPGMKPFWQVGFDAMRQAGEPRLLASLVGLIESSPFSQVTAKMQKWLTPKLDETREALEELVDGRLTRDEDAEALERLGTMANTGF